MSKHRYWQLIALLAASITIWWRPITNTLGLAIHEDEYTHILMIVPISLALIFLDRGKLASPVGPLAEPPRLILAASAFALALGSFLLARHLPLSSDVQLAISMAALVLCWFSIFIFIFGVAAYRKLLFPLCFLFWIIPWPHAVLDSVIAALQQYSALVSRSLFAAAGIPVLQQGVTLTISGLTIEIARECSSIRSSLMLVVTSMILAHLILRSPWRKLIIILLAVPLSVAKNGLRIFVLSMLGLHVDPGFLQGRLHHQGGFVFFAMALLVLLLFLRLLRRNEIQSSSNPTLRPAAV